jgi:phage terminase large subunit
VKDTVGGGFAKATLKHWLEHPAAMVESLFQVTPDPWQREACEAFPHTQRLAMKACKGPGKTAVEAWLILNFLLTRIKSKVNYTSITGDNITANLSPELGKWLDKAPLLGRMFEHTAQAVRHRGFPRLWYAQARTWPKKGATSQEQADALAGLHADFAMWVLDEAGGIPEGVLVSAEAVLASGIECKVVIAGNPTHRTGALYRACVRDREHWYVVTITGDPKRKDRSPRISLEWAEQQIKSYGRDNPWVMVNVLGEFPPQGINNLLSIEDVEESMRRRLRAELYTWAQKRLGVDVARFGDDRTVIFPRQGLQGHKPKIMRNARTTDIAAQVMVIEGRWQKAPGGSVLTMVDDTGHWGHGVIDNLTASGFNCLPVVYHSKALNSRYNSRRTEMYFVGSDWVKGGGALPDYPGLREELTEQTYSYVEGKIALEPKELLKERLGFSPDIADAWATTFAIPDMPGDDDPREKIRGRGSRTKARTHDDVEAEELAS